MEVKGIVAQEFSSARRKELSTQNPTPRENMPQDAQEQKHTFKIARRNFISKSITWFTCRVKFLLLNTFIVSPELWQHIQEREAASMRHDPAAGDYRGTRRGVRSVEFGETRWVVTSLLCTRLPGTPASPLGLRQPRGEPGSR